MCLDLVLFEEPLSLADFFQRVQVKDYQVVQLFLDFV